MVRAGSHQVSGMHRGRQGIRQLTALLVLAIVTAASGLPHSHTAPPENPARSDILLASVSWRSSLSGVGLGCGSARVRRMCPAAHPDPGADSGHTIAATTPSASRRRGDLGTAGLDAPSPLRRSARSSQVLTPRLAGLARFGQRGRSVAALIDLLLIASRKTGETVLERLVGRHRSSWILSLVVLALLWAVPPAIARAEGVQETGPSSKAPTTEIERLEQRLRFLEETYQRQIRELQEQLVELKGQVAESREDGGTMSWRLCSPRPTSSQRTRS